MRGRQTTGEVEHYLSASKREQRCGWAAGGSEWRALGPCRTRSRALAAPTLFATHLNQRPPTIPNVSQTAAQCEGSLLPSEPCGNGGAKKVCRSNWPIQKTLFAGTPGLHPRGSNGPSHFAAVWLTSGVRGWPMNMNVCKKCGRGRRPSARFARQHKTTGCSASGK